MSAAAVLELRARVASPGEWVRYADGDGGGGGQTRYRQRIEGRSGRRQCGCGCGTRSTYLGMANGICLTSGCEWSMRQWVRDPNAGVRQRWERYEQQRTSAPNGAVRCAVDGCMTPDVPRPVGVQLRSVRKVLRKEQGWSCDKAGDFCPAHRASR